MEPKLDPCVYYALIRIAVDEGAFYDPDDPREPMPIVKKHFAELKEKCPLAEHFYDLKLKNNEANKIKLIAPKNPNELSDAQKIIRNYYNTFISRPPESRPTLAKWEELTPLPDELSSPFMHLFNSEDKGHSRTRKQRKQRKQTRKQKQVKRK